MGDLWLMISGGTRAAFLILVRAQLGKPQGPYRRREDPFRAPAKTVTIADGAFKPWEAVFSGACPEKSGVRILPEFFWVAK